jgi:hypothetical protein
MERKRREGRRGKGRVGERKRKGRKNFLVV